MDSYFKTEGFCRIVSIAYNDRVFGTCSSQRRAVLQKQHNSLFLHSKKITMPGCDKDGVHLPQTSGFGQWTSGLSILLVLWTSESSENNVKKIKVF